MNNFALKPQRGPNGEPYIMRGGKGICYVCSVELTSQQHCQQHIQGNKHIKKERENSNRLVIPAQENAYPISSHGLASERETNARILSNRGPNGKDYDIIGPGGHCFVCGVDFTSVELATQHLAGQKHKKKAASRGILEIASQIPSGLVHSGQTTGHIPPSGVINSSQNGHLPSGVIDFRQIAGYIPSSGISSRETAGRVSSIGVSSEHFTSQNPSGVVISGQAAGYIPSRGIGLYPPLAPSRGPNGEPYVMKENRGYCYVCNLELTSSSHAQLHLAGKKHTRKNSDWIVNSSSVNRTDISLGSGINGVLMCSLCNVPFSSYENAEQHFRSEKHKKKEKLFKPDNNELSEGTQKVLDTEQTEVKKVYQPPVQKFPVRSDLRLNLKANHLTGFFEGGNQLGTSCDGHSKMSPTQTEDSESRTGQSNRENFHMPLASPRNELSETLTIPDGYRNNANSDITVKSEIDPQNSTHIDTDTRINFSSKLNELSKVGDKEIKVHTDDDILRNTPGLSLTDNNLQPSEENFTKRTVENKIKSERQSFSELDNTGIISAVSEISLSESRELDISSPVQKPPEFQQEPAQAGSVYVGLGQRMLDKVSSQVQQPSLCKDTQQSLTALRSVPYYFDGYRGYCYCCSVELTSLQHANQHLYGQKHQKKLGLWELTQAPQNGFAAQPFQSPSSAPDAKVNVRAEDGSYYFSGSRGFCHVCNIELTSFQHAQQHINGKPHRRSHERFSMSQKGVAYPLSCHICSKFFTGQESAQQHFTSAKHKSKADVLDESVQVLMVVDDGRVIMKDGQVWYFCDVCKVPLNTREQFVIHKESLKHKKECEYLRNRITTSPDHVQEVMDNKVILPDPVFRDLRALTYSRNSSTPVEEEGQNDFDIGQSRQVNNLCDSERQQSRDETERQQVLDENRHYLTFGQAPVIRRDSSVIAASGQQLNVAPTQACVTFTTSVNHNMPLTSSGSYNSAVLGCPIGDAVASSALPMGPSSALVVGPSSALVVGPSAALTLGHGSALAMGHSSALPMGHGSAPTMGHSSAPTMGHSSAPTMGHSSAPQVDQSPGCEQTVSSGSSYYSSAQSHLSSQSSSESSQMYEDMWHSLSSGSGHGAKLGLKTTSHRHGGTSSGGPAVAGSSSGLTQADSAARRSRSDPPESDSQGVADSAMEEDTVGQDGSSAGQNFLNSGSENDGFSAFGNLGHIISKPRPPGQSRSRGCERGRNVLSLDKKETDDAFDDDEEEDRDNYNIVEDEQLPKIEVETTLPKPMRSDKPGFRYYCQVCNRHMNTREAYNTHVQGKNHLYTLSNAPAPVRQLGLINKTCDNDIVDRICNMINKKLEITPRPYQIELVEKAMRGDCIIYLPTGTGKTLVAVLTMGLILQENPSRPVLFLVDKVLLVMQQAHYIINHFSGTQFRRLDSDQGKKLVSRELKIKPICGGLTTKTDLPIWKHDIVVTTAAYCSNMLDRGFIRWEDFSLVVLDEVHHCNKGHPYHRLMSNYHRVLPQSSRAKVLGLTASPAGKSTVEQTYIMLNNLLTNLGGATIAVVEDEVASLERFQSMAKVRPICVPMSRKEVDFKRYLLEYFILCYSQLASMTNSLRSESPPCSYFMQALNNPGNREVATQLADQFIMDPEPLSEVLSVIYNSCCIDESNVESRNRFDNLRLHICQLLLVIPEVGSGADIDEMLKALSPSPTIEEFKTMGLPCQQIFQRVKNFAEDGNNDLTMFSKLVETLQDPEVIDWSDTSSRALVLVRERKRAKQYCLKLRAHPMVKNRELRVGHIVGHGKGAKDGGMDVKKQRKVFDNHEKYHILVATSIMEEGIDIQALQLVVCMNPPNSLRALVQMRGRARREGSHFVVLCSSEEDVEKLNNLLKQEINMRDAARRCLEERRGSRN